MAKAILKLMIKVTNNNGYPKIYHKITMPDIIVSDRFMRTHALEKLHESLCEIITSYGYDISPTHSEKLVFNRPLASHSDFDKLENTFVSGLLLIYESNPPWAFNFNIVNRELKIPFLFDILDYVKKNFGIVIQGLPTKP